MTQLAPASQVSPGVAHQSRRRLWSIVATFLALALLAVASLFIGSGDIAFSGAWRVLAEDDGSTTALIVRDFRVPRTLLAILVGAALGAAGALIQAITRNPLADPGILGVNAGAYTAVVFAAVLLPGDPTGHVWIAMGGALVAALVVYGIGTNGPAGGGASKLVLTGVALGAVLTGVSFAVTLVRPDVFDKIRFWSAGSLQNRQFDTFWAVLPFIIAGLLIALALPRALNALALGEDVALALGSRPALTKLAGVAAVTCLCGAATAAAGPIAFVGLMVPHALRALVGPDQRWIVPMCLVAAPTLMLGADIVGRVAAPGELPVGVVTAFIGAPVLIALTRRKGAREL